MSPGFGCYEYSCCNIQIPSLWTLDFFYLGYLRTGLMGHMIRLCLIYKNYQIVFQSSCISLTIPPAKYWSSSCPTTSALGVAYLLTFNHSSGCVSSLSMRFSFAFSWWLMSFDPFIFHLPFVYFLLWLWCWWSRKPAWKTHMPARTQLLLKWWFKNI